MSSTTRKDKLARILSTALDTQKPSRSKLTKVPEMLGAAVIAKLKTKE